MLQAVLSLRPPQTYTREPKATAVCPYLWKGTTFLPWWMSITFHLYVTENTITKINSTVSWS